jgi:hypothetical protein
LRRIAIVDENPAEQFLAPEFALFRELFEEHGIAAVVCDPGELSSDGEALRHDGQPIDLIYNRLTDFSSMPRPAPKFAQFSSKSGVVLTPHPRAHALYADKRNLMLLSDEPHCRRWVSMRQPGRPCCPASQKPSRSPRNRREILGRPQALVLQATRRLRQPRRLSRRQADQARSRKSCTAATSRRKSRRRRNMPSVSRR